MRKGSSGNYRNYRNYQNACSPDAIILKSDLDERTRHRNGDTGDIIETIRAMDADSARWIRPESAECLRGRTDSDTVRNVWAFVKRNNRYRADRVGHERVKSPGALFTTGTGDCKSFSIAAGALLRELGIQYRYRFTAYVPGGDFSHVYIVARTSDGDWLPLDAVHSKPLEEVKYSRKRDMAPAPQAIGRIAPQWWPRDLTPKTNQPQTTETNTINWKQIGIAAAIIYLLAQ